MKFIATLICIFFSSSAYANSFVCNFGKERSFTFKDFKAVDEKGIGKLSTAKFINNKNGHFNNVFVIRDINKISISELVPGSDNLFYVTIFLQPNSNKFKANYSSHHPWEKLQVNEQGECNYVI